jgi:diguanylate cyclase (GGDEF)-like protein
LRTFAVDEPSGTGVDAAARRRRAILLGVAVAVPSVLVVVGLTAAWALFALPLALAFPLAGGRGFTVAVAVASIAAALASGRPGVDGAALLVGLGAFVATGLVVAVGHHAQEREAARIASLSLTDRLTGVHNYAFFEDALPRECRRAARYGLPLSLVLFDLDRFKAFNDRFGHDAGNRLLSAVGDAIRDNSRASDIAARFGGEEFAVIIPGPATEALEAAERIRIAVSRVRVLVAGGEGVGTTISAGVADLPSGADDDGTRLLERADKALYHSKAIGRDRVSLFSPEQRWAAAS